MTRTETEARQQAVATLKEAAPCMDCGHSFPSCCMDYDHWDASTKTAPVATLVRNLASWAVIEAEIAKCDLVCSNCHRIRTRDRITNRRTMASTLLASGELTGKEIAKQAGISEALVSALKRKVDNRPKRPHLTPRQRWEMTQFTDVPHHQIAEIYGVSRSYVSLLLSGKRGQVVSEGA